MGNNCGANAACTNTAGSFTCACVAGYKGDGTSCADVDECASDNLNNCGANAACTNIAGSFTCTCNVGYEGDGIDCVEQCDGKTNTISLAECQVIFRKSQCGI